MEYDIYSSFCIFLSCCQISSNFILFLRIFVADIIQFAFFLLLLKSPTTNIALKVVSKFSTIIFNAIDRTELSVQNMKKFTWDNVDAIYVNALFD